MRDPSARLDLGCNAIELSKAIFCVSYQACCASWTTLVSATLVRKAPTVTPTPSVEITSVPARLDILALRAIRMSTSAHWVRSYMTCCVFSEPFRTILYRPHGKLILSCYLRLTW